MVTGAEHRPAFIEPARTPPSGLPGLTAQWSRLIEAETSDGPRTFHVLERPAAGSPRLTILCVHGNPSWSYLWRNVVATAPRDVRVIALDHLDMGFSERTGTQRRLALRVDDLWALTAAMEVDGPVLTAAHDWGGPISLGWAQRLHAAAPELLHGVVLLNTAVHQPKDASAPTVIRMVRNGGFLGPIASGTDLFVRGGLAFSRPRIARPIRQAFLAPYRTSQRRVAIEQFVEDIPLDPSHPSAATLDAIADGLAEFGDVPSLLVWGAADPVFSDRYLHDLESRLPHASVQRHPRAGHFVSEDVDVCSTLWSWLAEVDAARLHGAGAGADADDDDAAGAASSRPDADGDGLALDHWISAEELAARPAVVEMQGTGRSVTFGELDELIDRTAAAFGHMGIGHGDRVALMIPPGIDLAACVYACWRVGAIVVLVDGGLGPAAIAQAVRSAAPDHLIGVGRAIGAAVAMRWPGTRWSLDPLAGPLRLAAAGSVRQLREQVSVAEGSTSASATVDDEAAVVFTSGSTGPSKGVVYRHGQIRAQVAALRDRYSITSEDRLVAAFAPFALFGPALGIASVVPEMDVSAPRTLTWAALQSAIDELDATLVFASPAALENTCGGGGGRRSEGIRLVLSAGAPVSDGVLDAAAAAFPGAVVETPYGMTELLPLSSVSLDDRRRAHDGAARLLRGIHRGVCVGRPVTGVEVRVEELDVTGAPTGEFAVNGGWGEIIARAPHMRDRYDRLWKTSAEAGRWPGWHCTGDVGSLDDEGRLWVSGRLSHVITTDRGPIAPVGPEQALTALQAVRSAAVVGVGPTGTQVLVAVVEATQEAGPHVSLALTDQARAAVAEVIGASGPPLAAVLAVSELPTDRRHNAKVDRSALAEWAAKVLAGQQASTP